MNKGSRQAALAEVAFCEQVLAKDGQTILTETLRGAGEVVTWQHYPEPDVFDPQSGAQWFYHCHEPGEDAQEHGHFHCFIRPEGVDGPIHHLCAVGVDRFGALRRLFTVNQWVVGDDWLEAEATVSLLPRFDVHMPRPSYLVNRWLTGVLTAYEAEIADLVRQRDHVLSRHQPPAGMATRNDRSLEVTSALVIDLGRSGLPA